MSPVRRHSQVENVRSLREARFFFDEVVKNICVIVIIITMGITDRLTLFGARDPLYITSRVSGSVNKVLPGDGLPMDQITLGHCG